MNKLYILIIILVLSYDLCFSSQTPILNEEKDKISYSIGYQIGGDFKKQNLDFDADALLKGIKDAISDVTPQFSSEEMHSILLNLKKKIVAQHKAAQAVRQIELKNLKEGYRGEGREFLIENAKKDGIVTLPSGLQYKIIRNGNGRTPGPNDSVTVHYRGALIDGTEFYNTYRENKSEEYRVDGVIQGWREALQLMKEGSKWQLFIPADLAYGERGPLADRTVIFELELISVKSSDKQSISPGYTLTNSEEG